MPYRLAVGRIEAPILAYGRIEATTQRLEAERILMSESRTPTGGTLLTAYRWIAVLFAVLIVLQAWLGSQGAFNGTGWMVTGHGHLANGMFMLITVQTALSWLLYTRRLASIREIIMNVVLVALTITQIGLGYSTRNGEIWGTMVSVHIPNGVLLMSLSTVVALFAFRPSSRDVAAAR